MVTAASVSNTESFFFISVLVLIQSDQTLYNLWKTQASSCIWAFFQQKVVNSCLLKKEAMDSNAMGATDHKWKPHTLWCQHNDSN